MSPIGEYATTNETKNAENRKRQSGRWPGYCLVLGGVFPMRAMMPATRSSVMPSATGFGSLTVRSTSLCAARAVCGFSARNFLILSTKQRLRHARGQTHKEQSNLKIIIPCESLLVHSPRRTGADWSKPDQVPYEKHEPDHYSPASVQHGLFRRKLPAVQHRDRALSDLSGRARHCLCRRLRCRCIDGRRS